MQMQPLGRRAFAFLAGVALLAFSGWANADPPSRVARIGHMSGAVSFSPAGESDWLNATNNRPLTTGDRLWAESGARAEVQLGAAMVRMDAGTGVSILNLDDRTTQLQLTEGTLNVRVRQLEPDQVFEIDTPNLAFVLRQPGEFRIEVDPDRDATTIVVRSGQGEVYGEGAVYTIDSRQPYRFWGNGLREYERVNQPRVDEFDRWSRERDRRYDTSVSARYVSRDVVGYQDLDSNGTWRVDATYGNVWVPNRIADDWAPYRDGHWAWVDPWGWTWIDDAPWGFAVSHYGRWANMRGTWGWVPGPVSSRAHYAPALVVFIGGGGFQLSISSGNVGGIGWFPLAPREVYRPSYAVSRTYFTNVNRSNTVINNTVINNYYDNSTVTNVAYANRQVRGAVVAVPTTTFVQSQPVSRAAVRLPRESIVSAPIAVIPTLAPTETSVRGAAAQGNRPPARVFERPVVARTAPPAPHAGFAAQQEQLRARPGKPLDEAMRRELKPARAVAAPAVRVLEPARETAPIALPSASPREAGPGDARGKNEQRGGTEQREPSRVAPAAAPPLAAPQAPAPQPRDQPPDRRGKNEQRGGTAQLEPSTAPRPTRSEPAPGTEQAEPGDPRQRALKRPELERLERERLELETRIRGG